MTKPSTNRVTKMSPPMFLAISLAAASGLANSLAGWENWMAADTTIKIRPPIKVVPKMALGMLFLASTVSSARVVMASKPRNE